jgi:autotransporter-associated beta strand protein
VIAAGTITTPSSKPTLRWVGTTNDTSDKVINIGNSSGGLQLETIGNGDLTLNGNINSSGVGGSKTIYLYPYTNSSMVVNGVTNNTTNTLSLNGVINDGTPGYVVNDATISNAVTTITLASVAGVTTGASISGGGCIANGTTISAVNTGTKVITLSQATTNTASISAGLAVMNVAGATAATALTIQPKSSAGSSYVNVVLGSPSNSFSGGVIFTNSQSGLVSLLKISKFGNPGENSSLGTAGNVTFGGASGSTCTLDYTGSGEVSSKTITLGGTLGTVGLSQSGTGLLKLTGSVLPGTTTTNRTLLLTGSSSGSGELGGNLGDPNGFALTVSKNGSGTWTLSGTNNYSGPTIVTGSGTSGTNSVLKVAGINAISTLTSLSGSASSSSTATLDLSVAGDYVINSYGTASLEGKGMNFTASSGGVTTLTFTNATNVITSGNSSGRTLNNNSTNLTLDFLGALDISSSTANDLTLGGVGDFKVRGVIFNSSNASARSLTKSGSGTLRLYAANTYNGTTTINDGNLVMANAKALPAVSPTVLAGGQLKVDYVGANSDTLGNLRLTADSTIDAGTGTSGSSLKFASATNWLSTNSTLKISSYYPVGAKIYIVNTNDVPLAQIKKQDDTNAVASLAADGLLTFSVPSSGSTYTGVGYPTGTENVIAANGLSNLMNYALGQNGPNAPFPAVPVLSTDSNGMTLAATARTDDSSLRFYVEWTTDLSGVDDSWHANEVFAPNLTGTIEYGGVRKFLRFKVTK